MPTPPLRLRVTDVRVESADDEFAATARRLGVARVAGISQPYATSYDHRPLTRLADQIITSLNPYYT